LSGYLDALVPAEADAKDLLLHLRSLGVRDAGRPIEFGPLDDATFTLIRLCLAEGRDIHLQFPRGRHDIAVAIGVYLQLMRRTARVIGRARDWFDGPVVVVGLNRNLPVRLRDIEIDGNQLSEALGARRLRADGQVADLRGIVGSADEHMEGLLYLNTSLGWPSLGRITPGVVVIDRTSFSSSETLEQALKWAEAQSTVRVVVIGDIGDQVPPPRPHGSKQWLRWSWTPGLRRDIAYELGKPKPCGPLSTNVLLSPVMDPVGTAIYEAPALTRLRRQCLSGVIAARRVSTSEGCGARYEPRTSGPSLTLAA
jgi:hypothetical protein